MASQDIPVIGPALKKIFGTSNERYVKRYTHRVEQITAIESEMRALTDAGLRAKTDEFRGMHDAGASTEEMLTPVFAAARESMDRHVGIRNVLDPQYGFDPSGLPGWAREEYEAARAWCDEQGELAPEGDLLGCPGPVPAWVCAELSPAFYDAVRELYPESRPPFRSRPFDVQLIGGMVLSQGKIAEMKTGEGKTIVAPLAAYLAAVERMQVHVVTVNDYLVQRDRDWVFPFFRGLGLTIGAIHPQHEQPEEVKRVMYRCDVVYGTTAEFGFDYLRDNMKRSVEQQVQGGREFAIVDEVDSVLIDEARTPLIISGPAHEDQPRYELAGRLARHLVEKQRPWQEAEDAVTACKERIKGYEGDIRQARDKDAVPELQKKLAEERERLPGLERERDAHTQFYEVKLERKSANLTHEGVAEAQRLAGLGSFYVDENQDIPHLLEQAVRAHAVYERDKDYIVADLPDRSTGKTEPSVVIVDTNTGRPMVGRQWSDGLHQAVEAKEGVPIKQETQTVASVTIQNFFKMYTRLSGMTGTADTEAQEFQDIYKLGVVTIPTNMPMIRVDHDDLMFLREKDKWEAIVDEIKHFHDVGRPVLVGTTSVEKSELISRLLTEKHRVPHEVLNAKQHEREADVVAGAGRLGAVMIATNMAGRGTDIKLSAISREDLLTHWQKRGIASRKITPESTDDEVREDVFRKMAPTELRDRLPEMGLKKRDLDQMEFGELERLLLRHWCEKYTWESAGRLEAADAERMMELLDASGRIRRHRIRWFDSIEDLGGLHVVGTERHESRRIDNQLRGRSGRQGDRGSSRFYVSLEDDLMKMFAGETTQRMLSRMGMKEGDAIEHPWLSKNVERAQRKVEERNFQVRKNILEYDEVMEVQRQHFYGLRQRVLEGRELRELIFEYVEDAIDDAVGEMLNREYPAQQAAEHAKGVLECSIPPERLRGKDLSEMDATVRRIAKEDAASTIDLTLGEYMPIEGSEVSVDFDSAGLARWAKNRFGVELDTAELREGGVDERRRVKNVLEEAAFERIDNADLSGLAQYLEPDYGAHRLAEWVERKFGFTVDAAEIVEAHAADDRTARDPILEKARDLYRRREIRYPVEFTMEMAMSLAKQDPQRAFEELSAWARRRLGIELTPDEIKKTPPKRLRERLEAEQEKFVDEDHLGRAVDEAIAIEDDGALDAHLTERFGVGLPDRMWHLKGEAREDAIRVRIENILRAELTHFERTILLDTLDQAWRDHLYAMDQLRDGISCRAFSQQDPRIQFKREGAALYSEAMQRVRDRLSDYIFKARMAPAGPARQAQPQAAAQQPQQQAQQQPGQQAPQQAAPRQAGLSQAGAAARAAGAVGSVGGSFSGPGFDAANPPAPAQPDTSAGSDRDDAPDNENGTEQAEPNAEPGTETGEDLNEDPNEDPETEQELSAVEAARRAKASDRGKQRKR